MAEQKLSPSSLFGRRLTNPANSVSVQDFKKGKYGKRLLTNTFSAKLKQQIEWNIYYEWIGKIQKIIKNTLHGL